MCITLSSQPSLSRPDSCDQPTENLLVALPPTSLPPSVVSPLLVAVVVISESLTSFQRRVFVPGSLYTTQLLKLPFGSGRWEVLTASGVMVGKERVRWGEV